MAGPGQEVEIRFTADTTEVDEALARLRAEVDALARRFIALRREAERVHAEVDEGDTP